MSESRRYTDMMKVNGRPALVDVTVHPDGTRYVHLDSIDYIDAELRAKLTALNAAITAPCPTPEQHRQECAAQLEQAEEYRSPFPAIVGLVAILGSIVCAVLGAATFGTGPLALAPMLGGFAWWSAAVALGRVAYRWIKAALR